MAAAWLAGCSGSSLDELDLGSPDLGVETTHDVADGSTDKKDVVGLGANNSISSIPKTTASIGRASKSADQKAPLKKAASNVAAQKVAEKVTAVTDPKSPAYKIGPMDVLEISVFKVAELSKPLQVSSIGTINVPLIGEREAAGRTAREVEKDLTREWGAKYLRNPQVSVFVKEYNSQRITIEGAVNKPGVYPIQGQMTLIQALATAQGLDEISDSTVVVFRTEDGKRAAARFDVAQIRAGDAPDPKLEAGDVIVAGKSFTKDALKNVSKVLPFASLFLLL